MKLFKCLYCRKTFSDYKCRDRKFCSHKCNNSRKEELAANWKGNKVGYRALHNWINEKYGKADHCSFDLSHKSKRYTWANVSGSYLRDGGDWTQLCLKCHYQYDLILRGKGNQYSHWGVYS